MAVPLVPSGRRVSAFASHLEFSGEPSATLAWRSTLQSLDSTASEVHRRNQLLSQILEYYEAREWGEVLAFLESFPFLTDVLVEAADHLQNLFGPESTFTLQLERDPETGSTELFGLVKTNLPPQEALQRLAQFDETWLLNQQETIRGLFNVDIAYE